MSGPGARNTGEDRRDSPRVPMRFLVRHAGSQGEYEAREGDIALGGFAWKGSAFEVGTPVEVRFLLPGESDEVHVRGVVLRRQESPPSSHERFVDLPAEVELAIARYLDNLVLGAAVLDEDSGGGHG